MTAILLTGGLGFIGSHTAVSLIQKKEEIIIFDNLINSKIEVLNSIEKITKKKIILIEGDIKDTEKLIAVIKKYKIKCVIHFAGLKSVGESVINPLSYYDVNLLGTISLVKAMEKTGLKKLVFSSSATVYGNPNYLPIDEEHLTKSINPYGNSKLMIEKFLNDLAIADPLWSIICLRYFNPIGAHETGLIGDNPKKNINNLVPQILATIREEIPFLKIYGNDYETRDGTGIRDYIYIMDLAQGHVAALDYIRRNEGFGIFNLGTGKGYSVLEVVKVFEKIIQKEIPIKFLNRRKGDVSSCYADPSKANRLLGWVAKVGLEFMCLTSWKFNDRLMKTKN